MARTKKGIYHNLKESKYTISNNEIVFFFSSELYLNNFLDRYKDHRLTYDRRFKQLSKKSEYNTSTLADISLYRMIEKRGFHVWVKGATLSWRELEIYALRKMTEKNTLDWSKIQKPKLEDRKKIMV